MFISMRRSVAYMDHNYTAITYGAVGPCCFCPGHNFDAVRGIFKIKAQLLTSMTRCAAYMSHNYIVIILTVMGPCKF